MKRVMDAQRDTVAVKRTWIDWTVVSFGLDRNISNCILRASLYPI